ncbi:c-type cytochrome [Aliiruegeria lutimaris]
MSQARVPSERISDGQELIAGGAPMVEVRLPAELSADAQHGRTAFDAKCAGCHGTHAAGQQGVAPPLVHKIYEPGHHGDMAFLLAAKTGVRAHHWSFGSMPPVEGISDTEIARVTLYIRELQRENGIR